MKELTQLTLAQIINHNFRASEVFEKFHLDFCCKGKRTLEEACTEQSLPLAEVKTKLEDTLSKNEPSPDFDKMNLAELCEFIVQRHHTYIRKELPQILAYLQKVASKHGERHPELYSIFEIFKTVKEEMESHMQKEELILFPRIKELQKLIDLKKGHLQLKINDLQSPITVMEQEHDHAGSLLKKIRVLSNDYNPPIDACTTYRLSYAVLQAFEFDLHQHVHLENNILFPKSIFFFNNLQDSVLN